MAFWLLEPGWWIQVQLSTAFKITLIIKETSIMALLHHLRAVFTMHFDYKGHAHQIYGFVTT